MNYRLLMTWDILPGREQEYFEFVVKDLLPKIQELGLEPNDAWLTLYGDQPHILSSVEVENLENIQRVIDSVDWFDLVNQLENYVENFEYKIVPAKGGFQT